MKAPQCERLLLQQGMPDDEAPEALRPQLPDADGRQGGQPLRGGGSHLEDRAGLDGHAGGPGLVARRGPGVHAPVPDPGVEARPVRLGELDGGSGPLEGDEQVGQAPARAEPG